MAAIEKYLAENPEAQGKDPQILADYVFQQSGMDESRRDAFNAYFLGEQDKGFFAKAGSAIDTGINTVVGAVKGDAEFPDMGNIQTIGAGNTAKVGMASVFGDDEDYTKALVNANPGSQVTQDKNGNPMLTLADGQQAYINQPGLDAEDVTRFVGKAAAFVPAGAAVIKAAGKGLLTRLGVAGFGAGATDAVMQKAAGRDDIDESQVAMTAILGAGAEAAAIPLGAAVKWAKSKYSNWKGMTPQARGRILATKMQVDDLDQGQLKRLGEWDEAGELVDPNAAVADSEFGYQLTRGQMMPEQTAQQRASQFNQLSKEEKLRSSASGQRFRDVNTGNYARTEQNIDEMSGALSGGQAQAGDQYGAANVVSSKLQEAARAVKSTVDDAYTRAREYPLDFDGDWVTGLQGNVVDRLEKTVDDLVIDEGMTGATAALKVLDSLKDVAKPGVGMPKKPETNEFVKTIVKQAKEQGIDLGDDPILQQIEGMAGELPIPRTGIKHIEQARRRVSRAYDKAANPEDQRAVSLIKNALDEEIDYAIQSGLFQGDGRAITALKEARALNTKYMKKFYSNDEAGKVVQKLLDPAVTPEQTAQYLIGVNGLTKAGASRVVRKYAEAVGKDSEAFNALREMTFLTLVKKPTGELKGHQHLVSALRTAMNGKGQSMMNELFTNAELAKMRRFVNSVDKLVPKGDFARTSGTAERLARFYGNTFQNTPLLGMAQRVMDYLGANQALSMPKPMAPRLPIMEATGATAASN